MPGDDRDSHETGQSCDLEDGEQVLHAGTLLRAARVDEREPEQQADAECLLRPPEIARNCRRYRKNAAVNAASDRDHDEHDGPAAETPRTPRRLRACT